MDKIDKGVFLQLWDKICNENAHFNVNYQTGADKSGPFKANQKIFRFRTGILMQIRQKSKLIFLFLTSQSTLTLLTQASV